MKAITIGVLFVCVCVCVKYKMREGAVRGYVLSMNVYLFTKAFRDHVYTTMIYHDFLDLAEYATNWPDSWWVGQV